MAELNAGAASEGQDDDISMLALGSTLLRRRRTIAFLGVFGAALGLAFGLLSRRVYTSEAMFIPQGSEASAGGLALAASQFGIRVPTSGGTWGSPVYVELLRSRSLLEAIALDTVIVREDGGRRIAIMDLLQVDAASNALRVDRTIRALGKIVAASEVKTLGAVKVSVITPWPSVSLALAERLVSGVNQFNLETRKSQASAERRFIEARAQEAEGALHAAEDRLQAFLTGNRDFASSPELGLNRDRLQRDVALRQQLYTTLLQSGDEARIREVRDTPVITMIEDPSLPTTGEPRKSVQKAAIGGFLGVGLGVLVAVLAQWVSGARREPSEESKEFFLLVEQATPRFLRRWQRRS
jgi:uncharacterized protein involved in exopolysaccharide biosynthesis